jgi:hypothetical protein
MVAVILYMHLKGEQPATGPAEQCEDYSYISSWIDQYPKSAEHPAQNPVDHRRDVFVSQSTVAAVCTVLRPHNKN